MIKPSSEPVRGFQAGKQDADSVIAARWIVPTDIGPVFRTFDHYQPFPAGVGIFFVFACKYYSG